MPAVAAVLIAVGLYTLLPNDLLVGPRTVVPIVELLLLVPLLIVNPVRMEPKVRVRRRTGCPTSWTISTCP
jgi:hypothetical protein